MPTTCMHILSDVFDFVFFFGPPVIRIYMNIALFSSENKGHRSVIRIWFRNSTAVDFLLCVAEYWAAGARKQ